MNEWKEIKIRQLLDEASREYNKDLFINNSLPPEARLTEKDYWIKAILNYVESVDNSDDKPECMV